MHYAPVHGTKGFAITIFYGIVRYHYTPQPYYGDIVIHKVEIELTVDCLIENSLSTLLQVHWYWTYFEALSK